MLHLKVELLRADLENMIDNAGKCYNTAGNKALAVDFKRLSRRPCPVHCIGVWDTVASLRGNAGDRFHDSQLTPEVSLGYHALAIDEKRRHFPPCLWEETGKTPGQTIGQLWVPGVHSGVGGGYAQCDLSNGALQWMAHKAMDCGLLVDEQGLGSERDRPNAHGPQHKESDKMPWRLLGKRRRKLPTGAKLHRSVIERSENNYRPQLPADYEVVD